MHYAFDLWMARTYPTIQFERYADDVIIHAKSRAQAELRARSGPATSEGMLS